MMRAMTVAGVLALAAGCGTVATMAPPAQQQIEAYRTLWVRLAAERNEMTTDAFLARVTPESPRVRCYRDAGTCMFEIAYRYRVGWIESTEQDRFFVRTIARGPWLSPEERHANLKNSASSPEHIGKMHSLARPLAFASFDAAKAAFAARFGLVPKSEVVWLSVRTHGFMHEALPVLEKATYGCPNEVLDLTTGNVLADEYCFEDGQLVKP
jgi:hypothetical protein